MTDSATAIRDARSGSLGFVIIGRNEGERLVRCLQSLPNGFAKVYVDSASEDSSVDAAMKAGAIVVNLDMARPFTAARARNEGFDALATAQPNIEFVQFIDGDCEMERGWPEVALAALENNQNCAAVAGRRRERAPSASMYNLMCDDEWNTTPGPVAALGGDFAIRTTAFAEAGGFDPALIAHEEPDLSFRLAGAGYIMRRIDAPMTIHDAAMFRFDQWWKRNIRAGYGFFQAYWKYRGAGRNPMRRTIWRAIGWAVALPLAIVLACIFLGWAGLLLLIAYPLLWLRIFLRTRNRAALPILRAGFTVLVKFPEAIGMVTAFRDAIANRQRGAVFYK